MNRAGRAAAALAAAAVLAVHVASSDSFGGVTSMIANPANSAASATLLYTHAYGSSTCTSVPTGAITDAIQTVACPSSLYPSAAAATRTDAITANGTTPTVRVTQKVGVSSCGAVRLANRNNTSNPMLARYGTTFATTNGPMGNTAGYVSLDGGSPGGYGSSITAQSQPDPVLGNTYGLGIWFRTSTATGGPLFGFGSSSSNVAGTNDRILYMSAAGKLGFVFNSAGATTGVTTTSYNDGQWHFAYVTLRYTGIIISLTSVVTLYVDGTSVASGGGLLVTFSSYTGYWHLGWSPTGSGNPRTYFAGSLSNFAVLNNGSASSNLTVATTQTQYDTLTSAASEHWRLNDDGTTTVTGTLPAIGTTPPCSYVDIQWGFTNPLSCAASPSSTTAGCTASITMTSFVAAGLQTVASAAPGTTQTSSITLSHDALYTGTAVSNFLAGLMIYAPLTVSMAVGSTPWSSTFSWSLSPGSTFLL